MRARSFARRLGAGIGVVALVTGVGASAAGANGTADVTTFHVHGATVSALGVTLTFTTGVPPGCTFLSTTSVIVPRTGNAVFHENLNDTGAWFTETLTGAADVVTGTGEVVATGHLTVWDGGALNQLFTPGRTTVVSDFTVSFEGMLTATGSRVSVHGSGGSTWLDATVSLTGTTLIVTSMGTVVRTKGRASCS